jgi:peptidyl-prolyl cis-trans isomerase C
MWNSISAVVVTLMLHSAILAQQQDRSTACDAAAYVNNQVITRAEFAAALQDYREELGRQLSGQGYSQGDVDLRTERQKRAMLDEMIDNLVLEQEAHRLGLEADVEYLEFLGDPCRGLVACGGTNDVAGFGANLRSQGLDVDRLHALRRASLLRNYLIRKQAIEPVYQSITEEERRQFYDAHQADFRDPDEVTLSEIFFPFENCRPDDVQQLANKVLEWLRDGAEFAEAVREFSPPTRASSLQGGRMGSFRIAEIKAEIVEALSTMEPSGYTEPIRLSDGYQIIRLDERKAGEAPNFDDPRMQRAVSVKIALPRAEEAMKTYVRQLRENAQIEICPEADH